jgi:hypothetical protein
MLVLAACDQRAMMNEQEDDDHHCQRQGELVMVLLDVGVYYRLIAQRLAV